MKIPLFALLAAIGLTITTLQSAAQDALDDDELNAAQVIDERTVAATVMFLASDELGGRGTPSTGFDIASAYVQSRMRAAGLAGMGQDGSFFQETSVDTFQTPPLEKVQFGENGEVMKHFGMLAAGGDTVGFEGRIPLVDISGDIPDAGYAGPVATDASQLGDMTARSAMRGLNRLNRKLNLLKNSGATAVLVRTNSAHPFVKLATDFRSKPQVSNRRFSLSLPVLLVDENCQFDADCSLQLPPLQVNKTTVKNTIGILEGSDPELKKQAIVFSAHLDHLGISGRGEDRVFNGADDNATGVTGVLSLADAYGSLDRRPKRSLIFITFWGEERGLLGSRYFVDNPLWKLDDIVANINLEMIGRPEPSARNKAWMTGWDQSDLGEVMARGAKRIDVEIFNHPRFGAMLYGASDNWPFVQKGVIAHSFSAGSLHEQYHQVNDHWELLDTEHMAQVIRGLFAGSLPIAMGEMTPKKSKSRRE